MCQQLKALAALEEDPGLIPSTHMAANKLRMLNSSSWGIQCPLLASSSIAWHGFTYTHAGNTLIHIKENKKKFKKTGELLVSAHFFRKTMNKNKAINYWTVF